jgi:hypothetical protein
VNGGERSTYNAKALSRKYTIQSNINLSAYAIAMLCAAHKVAGNGMRLHLPCRKEFESHNVPRLQNNYMRVETAHDDTGSHVSPSHNDKTPMRGNCGPVPFPHEKMRLIRA